MSLDYQQWRHWRYIPITLMWSVFAGLIMSESILIGMVIFFICLGTTLFATYLESRKDSKVVNFNKNPLKTYLNSSKTSVGSRGEACPHCGAHAFEILPSEHGMVIMKCLSCKGKVIA